MTDWLNHDWLIISTLIDSIFIFILFFIWLIDWSIDARIDCIVDMKVAVDGENDLISNVLLGHNLINWLIAW